MRHGGSDEHWMKLAIALARRGRPAPNPHVGAAIVKDGLLLSCGWHHYAGGPHAERAAIDAAGPRCRGATLYVTLEPCNHFGRTPPCADAVLAASLARVVIGCPDPNVAVLGGGAERLRRAGVEVSLGVCGDAAFVLIADWTRALLSGIRGPAPTAGDAHVASDEPLATPRTSGATPGGAGLATPGARARRCDRRAATSPSARRDAPGSGRRGGESPR